MTYAAILQRVEERTGYKPRPSGAGHEGKCSAHEDSTPSLTLSQGTDGRTLVCCQRGCEFAAIAAGLGLTPADFFDREADVPKWDARRDGYDVAARSFYVDPETGALVFEKERRVPKAEHPEAGRAKTFTVRRPDPDRPGGWLYNLNGCARPPYHAPKVRAAIDAGRLVFVVEGEKDADNLDAHGFTATTCDGGAGKWLDGHTEALHGARVVVIPDNDATGRAHARAVCRALLGVAAEVRLLVLETLPDGPPMPPKGDVSDWLEAGGTADALKEAVRMAPAYTDDLLAEPKAEARTEASADDEDAKPGRRSAASVLVDLMAERAELWHDREGEAYITIETPEGARPHYPLRTKNARRLMQRAFFVSEGRTPGGQATEDALGVLEGKAIWEGPEYRTAVRVAETEVEGHPRLYLDLGDESGRVVETYPGGWHIVPAEACPVRFVRRPGSLPLPDPVSGGDVGELRQFVNATPSAFVLLVAWLLMALRARGPFPVLGLTGEQGTGKSTAARMVRSLVDPNVAALRALPRNEREAFISASAAHVMVYDNVSTIYPNVSDVLCRIATGGGYSVRALYADADEQIFDTTNPQILTGIGDVVTRPDLAERTLAVTLERIPDAERTTEAALDVDFEAARPRILGALLDAAAEGLRLLPSIRPDGLPRMADFARFALACEAGGTLGFAHGSFLAAYDGARAELVEAALDSDPVAALVRALREEVAAAAGSVVFKGTSADLLDRLVLLYRKDDDKKRLPTGWPASPRALSSALTRCAPPLRAVGIDCERTKEGRDRSRLWVLRYTGQEQARPQPSAPSATVRGTAENGAHGYTGADFGADGMPAPDRPHAGPDRPRPSATVRTPSAENRPWEPVEAHADGADGADGLSHAPSGSGDGLNGSVPVLLLAGDFVGTPAGRGVVTAVHSDGSASVDVGGLVHSLPLSTLTADPYGAPPF